jgi:hypothetical protein
MRCDIERPNYKKGIKYVTQPAKYQPKNFSHDNPSVSRRGLIHHSIENLIIYQMVHSISPEHAWQLRIFLLNVLPSSCIRTCKTIFILVDHASMSDSFELAHVIKNLMLCQMALFQCPEDIFVVRIFLKNWMPSYTIT